jgi:ACS family hexuronate transporter-like MFS transporter
MLYTGTSLGAMLAPVLATALVAWLGSWRWAFAGVALIGLSWVPLWLVVTAPKSVRALLDAPPEASAPRPSLLAMMKKAPVLRAAALVVASSPAFAFFFLWSSLYLHDAHGVEQAEMGRYLWLPPLFLDAGALAFGFLAGRHASRHGPERSPVWLALSAMALLGSLAALPLAGDAWSVTLIFGVAMAGGGGVFAILTADLVTGVGPSLAASAGGITAAAQSVAYIVASPLIGRAVEATDSYDVAVIGVALWLVPGALVWIAMRPRVAA